MATDKISLTDKTIFLIFSPLKNKFLSVSSAIPLNLKTRHTCEISLFF